MGKYNDVINEYLSEPRRFADLINAGCHGGRQAIRAADLEEASEHVQSGMRDIKKRLKSGETCAVWALENQENVDYEMPYRIMRYDSMEYDRQVRNIHGRKREELLAKGLKPSRYAEKMSGKDKLLPVYTVCFYHGTEGWSGPRSLKEMMDFGKERQGLFPAQFHDYGITVIDASDESLAKRCTTELRYLLMALSARGSRQRMQELFQSDEFQNLDQDTVKVIAVMTDMPEFMEKMEQYKNDEGGYRMCKAMEELKEEFREEGRAENRVDSIRSLMQTLKMTAQEAMDALLIPQEERGKLKV